jgi:hypothetical protein
MRCKLLIAGSAAWLNVVETSVLVRDIGGHGVAGAHHLLSADGARRRRLRTEGGRRRHLSGHRRLPGGLCADAWPWVQWTGELPPPPLARPLWSEWLGSARLQGGGFSGAGGPSCVGAIVGNNNFGDLATFAFGGPGVVVGEGGEIRASSRGGGRIKLHALELVVSERCASRRLPAPCVSHRGPPRTSRASCRRTDKTHRPCSP